MWNEANDTSLKPLERDDWKVLDSIVSLLPQQFLKLQENLLQQQKWFKKSQEISCSSASNQKK